MYAYSFIVYILLEIGFKKGENMLHSITIPKDVLGTDVRVDYVYSGMTFRPTVISAGIEYDHETMEDDVVNYILDMNSEDMETEEIDEMEMTADNYIEMMVDERKWKS